MKKLIVLSLLLWTALISYSTEKQKITLEVNDSVKIAYKHQVAAVQAFIELRYYKRLDSVNTRLLDFRESQIRLLEHSLEYYKGAYRQCDEVTVPSLKDGNRLRDEKIVEIFNNQKKEKSKAFGKGFGIGIGTGVVLETAIILLIKFIPK